eukprot:COSAG01_NODE_675_length_14330_cov_20.977022_6_plen_62_part_00
MQPMCARACSCERGRAVTLVLLVSQPAKNINSIAPYTYVTSLRPMHMAPPILKKNIRHYFL